MPQPYPPPVDRLLTLGEAGGSDHWPDYLAFGLGPEHVPDLVRIALDPEVARDEGEAVWAPIHAWRALGQLRAVEAVEPLLPLAEGDEYDEWALSELPLVFEMMGAGAVAPLARFLVDSSRETFARSMAAGALGRIATSHPDLRGACLAAMECALDEEEELDGQLNGLVVSYLIDLKAVEAAPAMERAFADERVDESISGDWEDVQVALGMIPERVTPKKRVVVYFSSSEDDDEESGAPALSLRGGHPPPRRSGEERKKAKAKRKAEKASRRRNRRR